MSGDDLALAKLDRPQVLHPSFAEGTFNAGLMSTEAGTLGRFTGNLLLSVAGNYAGLDTRAQARKFVHTGSKPVSCDLPLLSYGCSRLLPIALRWCVVQSATSTACR